jgi:L-alanine-DL-glutamate epimerase-like enolase superfamily enzyme
MKKYRSRSLKISKIVTTPLLVPYEKPYHWAQGIIYGAGIILVEVHTDEGLIGYGESIATPSADAIQSYLKIAGDICIGKSPFENSRLMAEAYHALFQALGTCSSPRYSGQVFAGLEMALWDLMGKATNRPVHDLLGGPVRDNIEYFGFAQGETADEIALDADQLAKSGCEVIYVKVGRGDQLDLEIVKKVRLAIGSQKRLRLDPNEHWNPVKASRMIRKLDEYDIEFIEQPTNAESISSLAQVRANSSIAIAADQSVFTSYDAFNICREKAADLIVLGLHETGGLARFTKIAHIAEAAGIDICLHGLYETGITTCAANQVGSTISNLDDGNQYMNHFLSWDIIKSPNLTLIDGKLPVLKGVGLGFEIDLSAVKEAARIYQRQNNA